MSETRPSGVPLIAGLTPVTQEVADIDGRGRINLLPRWTKDFDWFPSTIENEIEALLVFTQPGRLSICGWEPDGAKIVRRYAEIADNSQHSTADWEAMRLIQDRYGRLTIPKDRRPYLGTTALQHLHVPASRGDKHPVYIVRYPNHLDVLSPKLRDDLLVAGHPEINDLP